MLSMKVVFVLSLALTVVSAQAPGGITPLSGDRLKEAEGVLNSSLATLAAGADGPSYKYDSKKTKPMNGLLTLFLFFCRLGRVITATQQTVSGSLYRYEVELIEGNATKKCNVEIWSQPWLENGIQVTFDCPEGKVVRKHSA